MRRLVTILCLAASPAFAQEILEPKSGDVVASPVTISVRCGAPCADGHTHMHVIVDEPAPRNGEAIPFDKHHIHVHRPEQTLTIDLPPGRHTVLVALGSGDHLAKTEDAIAGPVNFTVK